MARARDVADYLVHLAASEVEPQFLTHLQLQKLLYYVQGWSLAMRGVSLFPERIEAWAHGPVVRDLYPVFSHYGYLPITYNVQTTDDQNVAPPGPLTDDELSHVDAVWLVYKEYSGTHLRTMTHREPPWRDARSGVGAGERCDREITQQAMQSYFDTLANR